MIFAVVHAFLDDTLQRFASGVHFKEESYQSSDKDEVREIFAELERAGRKSFLAEKRLKPGDNFTTEIRKALKGANELWLLLSPHSLNSEWVQRECSAAWILEKPIVPILLRCSHSQLPEILSQTQAIDFHNFRSLITNARPGHS